MKHQDQFERLLNGPLQSIDEPEKLDDFWASVSERADQDWYIIDLNDTPPRAPADESRVQEFIVRCDTLIRRAFDAGKTPRIEVDDTRQPTLIRLRSDISLKDDRAEDWVMSRIAPADEDPTPDAGPQTPPDPDATTAPRIEADEPSPGTALPTAVAREPAEPVSTAAAETPPAGKEDAGQADTTREIGYLERFDGKLIAIRKWDDLDQLWASIHGRASEGWYIYTIGEPPPREPLDSQAVHKFLLDIDATLRQEHKEDYCGIVYADNPAHPAFIKIYDPHNLGMVCGSSGVRTLPGWTISLVEPVELKPEEPPAPRGFRRWKGFFRKS